jgi:hypothetical protein
MASHTGKAQHGNAGRWSSWSAVALLLFACHAASAGEFADHRLSFGEGPLWSVVSLAVTADGVRIALDDSGQVRLYSREGQLLGRAYEVARVNPLYDTVTSLCYAPEGDLYVLDHATPLLVHLDAGGALLQQIGGVEGSGPGEFSTPDGLARAPDGSLYVADFGNNRLQHFSADLDYLGEWAMPPVPDGKTGVAGPDAITVDAAGRVWVGWTHYTYLDGRVVSARLLIYGADGGLVGQFAVDPGSSAGSGWLFRYLAVDTAGHVRVFLDRRYTEYPSLLSFDEAGNPAGTMALPRYTMALALAADDSIVAAGLSDEGEFIEVLDSSGGAMTHWGDDAWAIARNMMSYPRQVAFGPGGEILVLVSRLRSPDPSEIAAQTGHAHWRCAVG